jgi:hypothetical protein
MKRFLLFTGLLVLACPAAHAQSTLYSNSTSVGIGTTSPAGTLDVEGGTAAASTNGSSINIVAQNGGSGSTGGGNILIIPGTGGTSSGWVGIGTSAQSNGAVLNIGYSAGGNEGMNIRSSNSTAGYPVSFWNGSGTQVGYISTDGTSSVAYVTSSDRRLKENLAATTKGLDDLMKINIQDYNFIADPKKKRVQGFVAQDLYGIYPEAVGVGDDSAKGRLWGVDYGRLSPLIIRAVQQVKLLLDGTEGEIKILRGENEKLAVRENVQENEIASLKKEVDSLKK